LDYWIELSLDSSLNYLDSSLNYLYLNLVILDLRLNYFRSKSGLF